MVKIIRVEEYRKIKNLELEFTDTINFISGTNGTCKTSLLHMISNSFRAVTKNSSWINDPSCLTLIKKINYLMNPKIESLTRGDKKYNDPARNKKGILYEVEYFGHTKLGFRKHNSKITNRYSIKPMYKSNTRDSLPACPIIYLGLSRLLPFGEYQNDEAITDLKKGLPSSYQEEIANIYKALAGINIVEQSPQKMGDVKVRSDFSSEIDGVDSNTISAGEDNLFILITAIVSLKYYYESIQSVNNVESLLLVDELDATLHPSLQFMLMQLLKQYAIDYKIQIICTTHSLSLLEYALENKENVIYLIDNLTSVIKMDSPDIYKIKMYLHDLTHDDIYLNKVIPVYTEDEEARLFLKVLFDYFDENNHHFSNVRRFFHLVNANIGCENLKNIFSDTYLLRSTMQSICILDGDQISDFTKCIITLPGNDSPETFIMNYSKKLYEDDDAFWTDELIIRLNLGKKHFRDNILIDINAIELKIEQLKSEGNSTHGVRRDLNKKTFIKHNRFFELMFKYWVNNVKNKKEIDKFYNSLYTMFLKVAEFHGINTIEWIKD